MKARYDGTLSSAMKSHIFQVSLTVFKDLSRLFHASDHFPDISRPENFNFKFHDFPNLFRICTNPGTRLVGKKIDVGK